MIRPPRTYLPSEYPHMSRNTTRSALKALDSEEIQLPDPDAPANSGLEVRSVEIATPRSGSHSGSVVLRDITDAPVDTETPNDGSEKWQTMSATNLKAECKSRGLKTSGTKSELIERLVTHDNAAD